MLCDKASYRGTQGQQQKSVALVVGADGEYYDEDKGNSDPEHDQLYLHVLQPHLPPNPCSLLPEALCLEMNRVGGSQSRGSEEVSGEI